ncbi:MAG: response regulator [Deferrisomatales bacterium]|nr:response regulator [Deferrisomatales bacterium]
MSARGRILLIDDEPTIRRTLRRALERNDFAVTDVAGGDQALLALQEKSFDVVITDLAMEGTNGMTVLEQAKRLDPDTCVMVITGFSDTASAVNALRLGAEDYVAKPFDYDEILLRIERCAERRRLRRKVRLYEEFLPMCASCHNVRDDTGGQHGRGEWLPLEVYLERKAGVSITHGYCPACRDKWRESK